jgi:hypothetical protein
VGAESVIHGGDLRHRWSVVVGHDHRVPCQNWPHGTVASAGHQLGQGGLMRRRPARVPAPRSGFAGFRFPPEVIMVAVRWYLRYGLSYRDVEELLAERGITVDQVKACSYTAP